MILGTEHAAAVRRAAATAAYLGKLDDAKRDAEALGFTADAVRLGNMIAAGQTAWQETQATIADYERQERAREATRAISAHARRQAEQLILHPEAQVL